MNMDTVTVQTTSDLELVKVWINFAASISLSGLMAAFLIFLFGRSNSVVYKLPGYKTLALKAALAMCTAGALLNAVTVSNPAWSEVVLNTGLAILFAWAAWFHYGQFVQPWRTEEAAKRLKAAIQAGKPKRRAVCKAAAIK